MKTNAHGGNVWNLAAWKGVPPSDILDFSSCVSSKVCLGEEVFKEAYAQINLLPEPYSLSFTELYGAPVQLTAGTTEAISALCMLYKGKNGAIIAPTYSDYEYFAALNGISVDIIYTEAEKAFETTPDMLERPNADIFFICTPNNPTGRLIPKEWIISAALRNQNTLYVVDESYMPFVKNPKEHSLEDEARENIAVLKSFSKAYGIPSVRLGYIRGDKKLIEDVKKYISPWSVSIFGQIAAKKLLHKGNGIDEAYLAERDIFFNELHKVTPLLKVYQSSSHFCVCKLHGINATHLAQLCAEELILIRDCTHIKGLGSEYIRLSLREGWQKLIKVLGGINAANS